jgi:hypothetical protein
MSNERVRAWVLHVGAVLPMGERSRPIVSDDPVCDPNPRVMEMCAPADKALKHGGYSTTGRRMHGRVDGFDLR